MPKIITPGTWIYDSKTAIWKHHFKVLDVDADNIYYRLFKNVPGFEIVEGKRFRKKRSAFAEHQSLQSKKVHHNIAKKVGFKANPETDRDDISYYSEHDGRTFVTTDGIRGQVRISNHTLSLATYAEMTNINFAVEFIVPKTDKDVNLSHEPYPKDRTRFIEGYTYILPSERKVTNLLMNNMASYIDDLLENKVQYTPGETIHGIKGEYFNSLRPINESLTNDVLLHVTEGNYSDGNYYRTSFPSGYGCVISKGKLTDVFYFDIRPINMSNRFEVYASSFIAQSVDFGSSSKGYNFRLKDPIKNDIWKDVPEMRIFLNKNHKKSSMDRGAISVSPYGAENNNILTEYVMDLFENTGFFMLKKHNHRFNLV